MDSNSSFNNFSIVIPIYNEEDILAESLNNIISICERTAIDYEIIISENGSNDSTKRIARVDNTELAALESHLKGSKSNLKSFLSEGLKINSESLFGVDPQEFGPLVVSIDLGPSRAFNSDSFTFSSLNDI